MSKSCPENYSGYNSSRGLVVVIPPATTKASGLDSMPNKALKLTVKSRTYLWGCLMHSWWKEFFLRYGNAKGSVVI